MLDKTANRRARNGGKVNELAGKGADDRANQLRISRFTDR